MLMKRFLPLLLMLASSLTLAESGAYRTEVIILRNLMETPQPIIADKLRSFSRFPAIEDTRVAGDSDKQAAGTQAGNPPRKTPGIMLANLPDDLRIITEKSPQMNEVWRSLRSSEAYRPLVYAAWDQNRTDYYPPMRIHDQQIIDTQLRAPTQLMVADLAADDPLAAYRSTFYQLDGSIQLRRSRFLHLFLDLEYRQQKPKLVGASGFFETDEKQINPDTINGTGINTAFDENFQHEIFTLKQNRQIRTGQMQYFDMPYFAALVLVTAIQPDP
jgi:hypothetical protein